jgi:membrane AbrB-like protein
MPVPLRLGALAPLLTLFLAGSLLAWSLQLLQVPAAAFLGYLGAGVVFGVSGSRAQVPPVLFRAGQACLGLLIAQGVTPAALAVLGQDWPIVLGGLSTTLLASVLVALGLIRFGAVAPRSAAWGTAPGAAAAMVAAAQAQGADTRMVATLQYLRILAAILTASLVSHWLPPAADIAQPLRAPLSEPDALALFSALAVLGLGVVAGARVPNGANLIPLGIGVALNAWHPGLLYLPASAALLAFAAIGLHIGLRFDRPTLGHIGRQLPVLLLAVFSLTLLCAGAAWLIAQLAERDFASLYFALSPGGLDAMAIMALQSGSPVPLVLALQTLRILLVVLLGGQFARLVLYLAQGRRLER